MPEEISELIAGFAKKRDDILSNKLLNTEHELVKKYLGLVNSLINKLADEGRHTRISEFEPLINDVKMHFGAMLFLIEFITIFDEVTKGENLDINLRNVDDAVAEMNTQIEEDKKNGLDTEYKEIIVNEFHYLRFAIKEQL